MVNRVHPDEHLMTATLAFTDRLAQRSAQALSPIKQAVRQGMPGNLGPSLDTIASSLRGRGDHTADPATHLQHAAKEVGR
jgi:enoyl-CoA hydratase/carnithine racemase